MQMDSYWTPSSVNWNRQFGGGLLQQGTDASPVGHWTQALARVLQGGMGGYMMGQANRAESAGKQGVSDIYRQGLERGDGMNKIAAALMGNPFGAEQGQKLGEQYITTQANQGFQREQQERQFAQQQAQQDRLFGQQRALTDQQHRNALAIRQDTDIVRNLRAAGIDPNSDEGRGIIRNSIRGGSPIEQVVAQAIQGAIPQSPVQNAIPSPRVQPQSMPGEADQPQMIPAQTAAPQAPAQPGEPMVDTPMGRMPESRAKIIAFGLAMQGKGDAGKMMAAEPGLGKTATNEIDEKIVKSVDQIARLEGMAQTFQDKYQTIGTRLGMTATGWMARIDPTKVKPEDARELAAFAQDRRRGIENLNLTIKEITGAAMSIPEAQRITQQVPNPGTGIFDGDDPVTYRSKLNDVLDQTRLALARNAWLKKNNPRLLNDLAARKMEGVEGVMPLDRMRDIMNERKNQIYQELRQRSPNASPQQLLPFVGQQLKQEFGI